MLKLECEALAEEEHDCQPFVEDCSAALLSCPLEAHGVLMYPLLLLTGNVPLATMLATTPQPATAGRELSLTASPPTVSRMLAPPTGTKWWCQSSDQEEAASRAKEEEAAGLDVSPEEHPHQRQKERRPLAKPLKGELLGGFKKDSNLVQSMRWAYFQTHCTDYSHEWSQDLAHTFQEMATSVGLMDSEVHEVQEVWTGQKHL